jgi:hypothetical protein
MCPTEPRLLVRIGGSLLIAAVSLSNTLSLFGLVLAIGLVVDDAIVVVEAVEHHIEKGPSPRHATLRVKRYCIHDHVAIEDGPRHDGRSCWLRRISVLGLTHANDRSIIGS